MESPNPNNNNNNNNQDDDHDHDHFFDALDDFPFYDCAATSPSAPSPNIPSPAATTTATNLRRRSLSLRGNSGDESIDSTLDSSITQIHVPKTSSKERRYKLYRDLERTESTRRGSSTASEEAKNAESTATTASDGRVGDSVSQLGEPDSSSLLVFVAGLVIKAIGFQFNLLIRFIKIPVLVLYFSYMLILDPFRAMKHGREFIMGKVFGLWNLVFDTVSPLVCEWLKEHESIWKLLLRFGWGLFWAIYVCIILCGLLVFSFVISGFLMRYLVEEPMQMREVLNFDFTKNSPVAFVPIMSCDGVGCGVNCKEEIGVVKSIGSRVIPLNHKLQVTLSLTLPESEYNRNLGVFQVRVDFLSSGGKTLASSKHPCMLQFKSEPIRLLLTFLKVAPLVAGFVSESQTLNVKYRGFTEGVIPTSCLKVMIEQRAEYRSGAGIPEIYDASLILESELPLFKRIIWYWKKTIFVWISMMSFMMELLFMLICCRPIIIPRTRPRDGSASNNATQNSLPVQT